MSQSELGALVPCDKSAVSRVEAGLTSPDEAFARACDAAFPQMGGWFIRFWQDSQTWGAAFPPALREFAAYEAEAVALWTFEHSLVPGLLQTEAYARAVLERHPHVTAEQVTERVAARLARQALDRDEPPLFWVLLDESVLHREIGGAKIMCDQLSQLADMARRPTVTVQVVPRAGAHVGRRHGHRRQRHLAQEQLQRNQWQLRGGGRARPRTGAGTRHDGPGLAAQRSSDRVQRRRLAEVR